MKMAGKRGQGWSVRDGFDCTGIAKAMHARHDVAELILRWLQLLYHGRQEVMVSVMIPCHAFPHRDKGKVSLLGKSVKVTREVGESCGGDAWFLTEIVKEKRN